MEDIKCDVYMGCENSFPYILREILRKPSTLYNIDEMLNFAISDFCELSEKSL